jgi:hypothetical protein
MDAVSYLVLPVSGITITNCVWRREGDLSSGRPETGVRIGDEFHLIQHGWWNFGAATAVILSRLAKGWSIDRIENFMGKRRSKFAAPFRARRARPGV